LCKLSLRGLIYWNWQIYGNEIATLGLRPRSQ